MNGDYEQRVKALSTEKALAVAAYGESVAAFRYRALVEKTSSDSRRTVFREMADEEQQHHLLVQELLEKHYPGSDFVLSQQDKELVIVGPRTLDLGSDEAMERSLALIQESERLTGRFYAAVHDGTDRRELQPLLREMADECFQHAERLTHVRSGV